MKLTKRSPNRDDDEWEKLKALQDLHASGDYAGIVEFVDKVEGEQVVSEAEGLLNGEE